MNDPTPRRPAALPSLPWWLHVILAIASYYLLKHVAPEIIRMAGYAGFAGFMAYLAPLVTIAFLLLAASSLYATDDADEKEEEPGGESDADSDDAARG
jgi:hypothetical protein